jgi:hypothetical protein
MNFVLLQDSDMMHDKVDYLNMFKPLYKGNN